MTDKASIRRSRRSKQIASAYELRQSGDWVYCIKRGTTQHHWHKAGYRNIQSGKIEPESSCEFNLDELHVMIVEYTGDEDSVVIPDQIDELPVLEMSDAAREGLTNVFTFVENAFGDGQEMLVLVTELTARYYCSRFISDYGCDKYFEHNSDLLIYQRENDLKARIEQLGITQEQ